MVRARPPVATMTLWVSRVRVPPAFSTISTALGDFSTPAPSINNPVHLCLKNGAVWTVVGTSYLDVLELDENSKIIGTVTVNGTAVSGAGRYRGQIVVTATA